MLYYPIEAALSLVLLASRRHPILSFTEHPCRLLAPTCLPLSPFHLGCVNPLPCSLFYDISLSTFPTILCRRSRHWKAEKLTNSKCNGLCPCNTCEKVLRLALYPAIINLSRGSSPVYTLIGMHLRPPMVVDRLRNELLTASKTVQV